MDGPQLSPLTVVGDNYIMQLYYVPLTFKRIRSKSLIVWQKEK
jgi:hypothetical protein